MLVVLALACTKTPPGTDSGDSGDVGCAVEWYADADGDGFGDPDTTNDDCEMPDGYLSDGSDCDDGRELVNPDADEICNDIDDDCDGVPDDDPIDGTTYYEDSDGDGYGGEGTVSACELPRLRGQPG
ncbi:MAG TPA: MopE-related protein [Myxococcota bacterium]|nr:MopE-related protein [Myxococcota bacterium]